MGGKGDSPDFPVHFSVLGTEACWMGSVDPDADGAEIGGFVAIRVDRTGIEDKDWLESDVRADTRAAAEELATTLIDEWADRHRQ